MGKEPQNEIKRLKREVTKYKELIKNLLKERSEYLRLSAHQMKSPLSTISFSIETLIGEYAGRLTTKQIRIIESIKKSADALQNLIRDILELERFRMGKVEFETVDFVEVCMQVVEEIREKVQEKDIYFEVNIPNKILLLRGNKVALRQMIYNLLDNAVKYTNKNGTVSFTIGYDIEDKIITTIIKDTGIGIPEESQKRIFEEFYRAPNAKRFDRTGTGFGMAIVKQVLDLVGGDIKLWSKPGKGTRITLSIPLIELKDRKLPFEEKGKGRKKIVVIGGVAAGPKAASRARRLDSKAEITVFEKGYFLAYAGCSLPYYISGKLKNLRELAAALAGFEGATEFFRNVKGIEIKNLCEVKRIDRVNKMVQYHDIITDRLYSTGYDILILATGSVPIKPDIDGIDLENIFTMRGIYDAEKVKNVLASGEVREIIIVGGGLIGVEIAEALTVSGARVTIVEKSNQILSFLDPEMAALVEHHLEHKGIRIIKNETVERFLGKRNVEYVQLKNYRLPADMVVLAIGITPNVKLAKDAGIEIGPTGAIKVNEYLQTSDPSIYAAGDCAETINIVTGKPYYLPLGSVANRQGRIAGTNTSDRFGKRKFLPVAGTIIIRVFDYNVAKTGLSEVEARANGLDPISSLVPDYDREQFIPEAEIINVKLIACRKTRRVLGAQIIGKGDVAKRIDVTATALSKKAMVDELSGLDLGYAPPYSNAMGAIIVAANVLQNKLDGLIHGITSSEVCDLISRGGDRYLFLDVRTPQEYEEIKIPGFELIPLENLRSRIGELPTGKSIILACDSGARSYQASLILKAHGFEDVRILEGGLRMWPCKVSRE